MRQTRLPLPGHRVLRVESKRTVIASESFFVAIQVGELFPLANPDGCILQQAVGYLWVGSGDAGRSALSSLIEAQFVQSFSDIRYLFLILTRCDIDEPVVGIGRIPHAADLSPQPMLY